MNLKKLLLNAVATLSLCAIAGTASAAITSDINLYGASAQFIMWRDNAGAFMTSEGCTGVQSAQLYVSGAPDGKNAISKGTCSGATRYFRTSAKASYDGILAMQGNTTHPNRVNECPNATDRKMIDEATCNFTTGQCTGTKCVSVTVGASDVPVECFAQESHGALKGPLGGVWTDRNFKTNPIGWTGAEPCKPLVVPFAFFVNNTVKKSNATITNIARDNAEILFSGQAYNWSDLVDVDGNAFDAGVVTACLRHAGSGTHASLDAYITSDLIVSQAVAADHKFYFNDGSSDEMKCVNGSGAWTGAGAIGYADADQNLGSYANTRRIALNSVTPAAATIANGTYNFYGLQQLYGVEEGSALCDFAGNPDNIINPLWVARCKMVFDRSNGCEAFPVVFVGATCP